MSALIFLGIVILFSFMVFFHSWTNSDEPKGQITVPDTHGENNESNQDDIPQNSVINSYGMISIPGYETLTLRSENKKQKISFNNPKENNCYFVISLYFNDGTCLWKSDYIKPGAVSKSVVLSEALNAGTYKDCILKYECFSHDASKKQLNGAETKVTLIVK